MSKTSLPNLAIAVTALVTLLACVTLGSRHATLGTHVNSWWDAHSTRYGKHVGQGVVKNRCDLLVLTQSGLENLLFRVDGDLHVVEVLSHGEFRGLPWHSHIVLVGRDILIVATINEWPRKLNDSVFLTVLDAGLAVVQQGTLHSTRQMDVWGASRLGDDSVLIFGNLGPFASRQGEFFVVTIDRGLAVGMAMKFGPGFVVRGGIRTSAGDFFVGDQTMSGRVGIIRKNAGTVVWTKEFGMSSAPGNAQVKSISELKDGSLLVSGNIRDGDSIRPYLFVLDVEGRVSHGRLYDHGLEAILLQHRMNGKLWLVGRRTLGAIVDLFAVQVSDTGYSHGEVFPFATLRPPDTMNIGGMSEMCDDNSIIVFGTQTHPSSRCEEYFEKPVIFTVDVELGREVPNRRSSQIEYHSVDVEVGQLNIGVEALPVDTRPQTIPIAPYDSGAHGYESRCTKY